MRTSDEYAADAERMLASSAAAPPWMDEQAQIDAWRDGLRGQAQTLATLAHAAAVREAVRPPLTLTERRPSRLEELAYQAAGHLAAIAEAELMSDASNRDLKILAGRIMDALTLR
jgi:hypothetical protein